MSLQTERLIYISNITIAKRSLLKYFLIIPVITFQSAQLRLTDLRPDVGQKIETMMCLDQGALSYWATNRSEYDQDWDISED